MRYQSDICTTEKERQVHIMKNEIRFTLEPKQRPKLAQEIGKILGTAPHYERVPSCAYDIAGYRLDKEGVLHIPEGVEAEMVENLIRQLRECGFQDDAEFTEEVPMQQNKLTIAVPKEVLTDTALGNLQKIIANKQTLLQRAFQADSTEVESIEEKINFAWFPYTEDGDEIAAYPFGFQLLGVVVNDSVTREAITKDQMRKFLKFVHDDYTYCKYYEAVYILFHTGMRISEFCGLTLKDIDLKNKTVNIDHQLQRLGDMKYFIEETKTDAGKRKIPITDDVAEMFQAIIEDRQAPKHEQLIDGYGGFLFYDENGKPLVAMHWQHRFNHMVGRYNDIYRVQMPIITPHVCRHTYCSNQAKAGMNPKTLQYLMGHSDISVTMNVYTHIGFDDAEEELKRMEELGKAQAEIEKQKEKPVSQRMFKAI